MDLDQLRNSYRLKPLTADPRTFLLDPHNPRIALLLADRSILKAGTKIESQAVQRAVENVFNRPEFALRQLSASIRQRGFVNDGSQMLVKRVGNCFLVLEGNRRTAALRQLLAEPSLLSPAVRTSIQAIELQEFTYLGAKDDHSERDVIEMILGQIHISGRLSWGALERADYIYQSYCRMAKIGPTDLEDFYYNVNIAGRVGELFSSSTKDVRTCIMIARNFIVLREAGAAVGPSHYSLIELATTTRAVKEQIFGLCDRRFHFNEAGVRRFIELCVEEDRIISNPKDFRTFKNIVASGDEALLKRVTSGDISIEHANERLTVVADREQFARQLDRAFGILRELRISAFHGTEGEKQLINQVSVFIEKRLKPLGE